MGDTGAPANLPYPDQSDVPSLPAVLEDLALAIEIGVLGLFGTGTVLPYGGAVAPPGWAICDGTPHGSPALTTLLGTPNAPDLRDRIPVGAGPKPVRSAGGARQVALTASHVPPHTHNYTSPDAGNNVHTHTFNGSGGSLAGDAMNHIHGWAGGGNPMVHPSGGGRPMTAGRSPFIIPAGISEMGGPAPGDHAHTVQFNAVGSGGMTANHTHGTSTDSQGGGALHGGPPPYYAVNFIIKK